MPINRQNARPLSAQIADDLRRRVATEQLVVGEKIPSLRALAEEYSVAELTVHAAVKELQHEGVLASTSGRGTFVKALPSAGSEEPVDSDAVLTELRELRQEVEALRTRVEAVEQSQRGD
ncbi:GntR family transcriptional regulator [Lentzea tibetensis]|uniref:GntR family transcriptional regulator n=1 Tax=Lentzea tibetensis TaxID=2591470 RepID=UPI0016461A17|nr:GntR family transcriptional regulator [Lentzea tibetensis]